MKKIFLVLLLVIEKLLGYPIEIIKREIFMLEDGHIRIKDYKAFTNGDPLEISIMKWEFIVEQLNGGSKICDSGYLHAKTCRLCVEHLSRDEGKCLKCPVYKKTGRTTCMGSPFPTFMSFDTVENAQKEVDFLKDLRNV